MVFISLLFLSLSICLSSKSSNRNIYIYMKSIEKNLVGPLSDLPRTDLCT